MFIPIYDAVTGSGDNAEFHISSWGVVTLLGADLSTSSKDMYVKIQRCYTYDASLKPKSDLGSPSAFAGVFAGAILVE